MNGTRRPDIDWLRVLATYLLFVFHVGKVFDPAPFYHIRNADLSFVMLVVCGFIGLWHMPLFFLLAGWSAAVSLEARGRRGFLGERLRRLAVPLLAGCVLLIPAIKYLELRSGLDRGLEVLDEILLGIDEPAFRKYREAHHARVEPSAFVGEQLEQLLHGHARPFGVDVL